MYKWPEKLNRLKAVLNTNISHTEHTVHVENESVELTLDSDVQFVLLYIYILVFFHDISM